jgi:hypothetical protein
MNGEFQGDVYRAYECMDTTKVQNVVSLLSQTNSPPPHTHTQTTLNILQTFEITIMPVK